MRNIMTRNGKILSRGGHYIYKDNYNPLGLPPYTIRCKYATGTTPTEGESRTLVDQEQNIWDITNDNISWSLFFNEDTDLIEVLGANSTGVTDMTCVFLECHNLQSVAVFDTTRVTVMEGMFDHCISLTTVPLFNTSSCENMQSMFNGCSSLTSVPLFDTSSCTRMPWMFCECTSLTSIPLFNTENVDDLTRTFYNCYNVESGALALYQQASTQANPPTYHYACFFNCGANTVTGSAELAQIPDDWKQN
jgi:surface protein